MLAANRVLLMAFASLAVAACGGGGGASDTTPDQPPEPPSVCKVDEAVKATAKPKPKETGCIDKAQWAAQSAACASDKDPVACYQIGVCLQLQSMGNDRMTADEKAKHFTSVLQSMRISCDAGIANACLFRAGVIGETLKDEPGRVDKDTLAKEKCADLVRACQLGDESGGCYACRLDECK